MKSGIIKTTRLLILAVILFAAAHTSAQQQPRPKLWVDTVLYTHGTAIQGETITRPFTIKNLGTANLVIDQVEPD